MLMRDLAGNARGLMRAAVLFAQTLHALEAVGEAHAVGA
jgi:hypothetical protein